MPFHEWKRQQEQTDLFDVPVENPEKMLILASDVLLDPVAQRDELEARERLKTACARAFVRYDSTSILDALTQARGRRRA